MFWVSLEIKTEIHVRPTCSLFLPVIQWSFMHVFALPLNKSSKYPFQTYSSQQDLCINIVVGITFIYLFNKK